MFTQELLKKYHMVTLEEYKGLFEDSIEVEIDYYKTFLIQTDHIPNKIIEAQTLGEKLEDYTEILQARKYARDKINKVI